VLREQRAVDQRRQGEDKGLYADTL
jgi:hypothetical protein